MNFANLNPVRPACVGGLRGGGSRDLCRAKHGQGRDRSGANGQGVD
jgi:hypothetical protein